MSRDAGTSEPAGTALPPEVSGWAGSMVANPERWLALLLDGELQGVPYAEAY